MENAPEGSVIKSWIEIQKICGMIRNNPEGKNEKNEIARQLIEELGYDYFGGVPIEKIAPEHVIKIYKLSINYLYEQCGSPEHLPTAKSPLDVAGYYENEADVENLIKNQFKTKWATTSGRPETYTYYEFCNKQGTTNLLKYNPRRENIFVQVYTKCLSMAQLPEDTKSKEKLCPKVYLKASNTWKEWNAENNEIKDANLRKLKWMKEPIRQFVLENADNLLTNTDDELIEYLKKPTLYWAVIEDTDFPKRDRLNLNDIGKTQVYVGTSTNGIHGRWLRDGGNHTEIIKECLDVANKMIIYKPDSFKDISLVHARLALAKLRGEKCAVFLMKMFDYDVPAAEEIFKTLKITHTQSPTKSEANRRLRLIAEKRHINGKRFPNDENIIPENTDNNLVWKPKDMAYGMSAK